MLITDYLKYKHPENIKAKTRFELVASSQTYELFENSRDVKGVKRIYYTDIQPGKIKANTKRTATKMIADYKGNHMSSVYVLNFETNLFAYGDVKNTTDLILFLFNTDYTEIEIFICRSKKNDFNGLFTLFTDNKLINDIEYFRNNAKGV
jgi:hypothetical protein